MCRMTTPSEYHQNQYYGYPPPRELEAEGVCGRVIPLLAFYLVRLVHALVVDRNSRPWRPTKGVRMPSIILMASGAFTLFLVAATLHGLRRLACLPATLVRAAIRKLRGE